MADESKGPLSLDSIVRDVAEQLHALRQNPPKDPVIAFTGCEIELSVTASVSKGGGIKFYVFSADVSKKDERVSKIKLIFGAAGTTTALIAEDNLTSLVHKRQNKPKK
jgi:hypothetical protein